MEISKTIANEISNLLLNTYSKDNEEIIGLHEPSFSDIDKKYIEQCIVSGMVSTIGTYVEDFEDLIASYTGAKYVVATVNGTTALHLALIVSELPIGSEILVPSLSFVASANAVVHANLVPHFVNSEPISLGIDVARLKNYIGSIAKFENGSLVNRATGRIISGIMPMHCFGHPCNISEIVNFAQNFKLKVIEDAAEALGSFIDGKHCGTFGDIGIISFNGNKVLTTGGGGVLLTNSKKIFDRAKHLSTTAKVNKKFSLEHDQVGYNYRMPNINAALGVGQFQSLKVNLEKKRQLTNRLKNSFKLFEYGKIFSEMKGAQSNYWLNALCLRSNFSIYRGDIISELSAKNFMVRPCWTPLHMLEMYLMNPRDEMLNTERLAGSIINLPSSPALA